MKKLTVIIAGGIGSRLLAYASAMHVAATTGREISFIWPLDDNCGASFADLFQSPALPMAATHDMKVITALPRYTPSSDRIVKDSLRAIKANGLLWSPTDELIDDPVQNLMIKLQQLKTYLYDLVPFNDCVKSIGESVIPPMYTGVHIRTRVSQMKDSITSYADVLRRSYTPFYLASDNVNQVLSSSDVFGSGRCYLRSRGVNALIGPSAAKLAVIELFVLAMAGCILGSRDSSFSLAASVIGNTPLTFPGDEPCNPLAY